MMKLRSLALALLLVALSLTTAMAADLAASLKPGKAELKSAGPLAFGPEGILFVGDPQGAAIFALATGDTKGTPAAVNIQEIDKKVAAVLGTTPKEMLINDLAVNPASGKVYLSISRGTGPDATPVIVRVDAAGKIEPLALDKIANAKAMISNAPAAAEGPRNPRLNTITDIAYADGKVLIAGLSNEEFASTLRQIPFPFTSDAAATGVRIFHGAHGRFETNSPINTFTLYNRGGNPEMLAAYTCTPLVQIPLTDLKPGAKVTGKTIAELGNMNRPLDMFVYEKMGKDYVLLANSARGVMKIATMGMEKQETIAERINGTAGQPFEKLESMTGVMQLDRLDAKNALALIKAESGDQSLKTIELP